jgi:hypothetical protein
LIKKYNSIGVFVTLLVILLTIPTTLDTLKQYLPSRPPARLSLNELDALNFLKAQPFGIVVSTPYDSKLKERYTEPIPLNAYVSSSYISAFSSKPEYVADLVNLDILGIDYKNRLQAQKEIFAGRESEIIKKVFKDNHIEYIYLPKISNFSIDQEKVGVKKIYGNDEIEIYKVL